MIDVSRKTTKKLNTTLLMSTVFTTLCIGTSAIAADTQTSTALAKEIAALQQQITDLNKKIQGLEISQTTSAAQAKEAAILAAKQETAAAQAKTTPTPWVKGPDGYISVPGSNTAIKLGGRVRVEGEYDAGPSMGDYIVPGSIPLKNVNNQASQSGNTNAHARSSRLSFESLTPTASIGDVKTRIEIDFFNGGTGGSYLPKLRHAYGDAAGFLVGQTDSVFVDMTTLGSNIDYNGILGGVNRQAQVRYTMDMTPAFKFAAALEKPASDYIGSDGTLYTSNDSSNSKGKSSLPDLTAMLKYSGKSGFVTLRGMARQIQYRSLTDGASYNTANDFSAKATAWGVGLSGKFITVGKSAFYAQLNTGQGVGRYIPEIAGEAAYFNPSTKQFNVLKANNALVGYEHYWTDDIRTNIQASYTRVSPPAPAGMTPLTGTTRITQKIKKVFFNIFYTPVKNVETGLEFAHIRRDTVDNKTGSGNRVAVMVSYNF